MSTDQIPRILIVEDEKVTAKSIEKSLKLLGFEVVGISSNYENGIEKVIETEPDLILMDIKLEGVHDGITLTQRIQTHTDVPIIFLTAHSDSETLSRALHTSPYGYLIKPYDDNELNEAILYALNRYQLKKGIK